MKATLTQNYYFNKVVYFDDYKLINTDFIIEEINYLITEYKQMYPSIQYN
jgi:hypothetical protein